MKISRIILLLIFIQLVPSGCRKENLAPDESSWIQILQTGKSYFGSNIVVDYEGNLLVACIGKEDPNQAGSYGELPSLLIKLDRLGHEIWKTELPESVYLLWGCIALENGNTLVYGFDSQIDSEQVGAVLLDESGDVIAETSFFNQTANSLSQTVFGTLHAIESSDGTIKLLMPQLCCGIFALMPRIVSFDQNLNIVSDVSYNDQELVPPSVFLKMTMHEDDQQNLLLGGETGQNGGDSSQHFAFQMKLTGSPLTENYLKFYHSYGRAVVPSRSAMTPDQNARVWASAGPDSGDTLYSAMFNVRGQEIYSRGPVITFWKTFEDSQFDIRKTFSGFPKNAVITKVKSCSSGGYIAVGTCNINSNQDIPSDYRVLLIKLSENLDVEWVRYPNTNSQSLGVDVIEYESGYIVLGTHFYSSQHDFPMLIKTDALGNMN